MGWVGYDTITIPPISTKRISTGYTVLDKYIGPGGFRVPSVVAVGGWSGLGKTTFIQNLLRRMKCRRGLITLEDQPEDAKERLSRFGDVCPGLCVHTYIHRLEDVLQAIADAAKFQVEAIAIDYIGLISVSGQPDERMQLVECVRQLVVAARQHRVCLIVGSQLNDQGLAENRRPRPEDLFGSRALRNAADLILLLYTENYVKESPVNDLEVIIGKQRMGADKITIPLVFDRPRSNIYEDASRTVVDMAARQAAREERAQPDSSPGAEEAEKWLSD